MPEEITPPNTATIATEDDHTLLLAKIEAALDAFSDFGAGCPNELRSAIRYSLLSPGKRLRPCMVLFAASACGGDPEVAMPAACAVEMIHAYSLIHDDLPAMDDDDLRRGKPTCHKAFNEPTAILAGDALLARAFEVLANHIADSTTAVRCIAALSKAAGATELVGGQADDLANEDRACNIETLETIHRRKTGAMFNVSLRLGGLVASASEAQLAALQAYGEAVGLVFQITDDLLDVAGEEEIVGKRLRKDEIRGKMTYPAALGIEGSQKRAKALIGQAHEALTLFGDAARPLSNLAAALLNRTK